MWARPGTSSRKSSVVSRQTSASLESIAGRCLGSVYPIKRGDIGYCRIERNWGDGVWGMGYGFFARALKCKYASSNTRGGAANATI